jgi:hypothetical protein
LLTTRPPEQARGEVERVDERSDVQVWADVATLLQRTQKQSPNASAPFSKPNALRKGTTGRIIPALLLVGNDLGIHRGPGPRQEVDSGSDQVMREAG